MSDGTFSDTGLVRVAIQGTQPVVTPIGGDLLVIGTHDPVMIIITFVSAGVVRVRTDVATAHYPVSNQLIVNSGESGDYVVITGVLVPTTVDERMAQREESMRRYFDAPLQRFRVRPTVFMPTLPPLFDLSQLDRLIVGLSDGEGGYTGIGYLEPVSGNGGLRLISPVADPPKALRLGSVRLEETFRAKRVDLRNLFGTE